MEDIPNVKPALTKKASLFRRKKNLHLISLEIEVKDDEKTRRDEKEENVEGQKRQKQVIRRKRALTATSSVFTDVYILPEDIKLNVTTPKYDTTIIKVMEPYYKSEAEHESQGIAFHQCACNRKVDSLENESGLQFKGGFRLKALELLAYESVKSQEEKNEPSDHATIQVTASLSAEISPLLKLVSPILANYLDCPVEAVESMGSRKDGIEEILSQLASLLSQKTILCDFAGMPKDAIHCANSYLAPQCIPDPSPPD